MIIFTRSGLNFENMNLILNKSVLRKHMYYSNAIIMIYLVDYQYNLPRDL